MYRLTGIFESFSGIFNSIIALPGSFDKPIGPYCKANHVFADAVLCSSLCQVWPRQVSFDSKDSRSFI